MIMAPWFGKEWVDTVCILKKSLYDHKQSLKAWLDMFAKVMRKYGYQQGQSDHTLFSKQNKHVKRTILIVYVNDIILTGDNLEESERPKEKFG